MKRIFLTSLLTLTICFSQTGLATAADVFQNPCAATPDSTLCKESQKTQNQADNGLFGTNGVITKGTRLVAMLVGIASIIMLIIGGLKYILSSGDPNNINSAKNTIIYAIVGLVVAVAAQGIVVFVLGGIT